MSINLRAAFKMGLRLQVQDMEITNLNAPLTVAIKAAPSNYDRNQSAPEESVVKGKEFVIDADELETFGPPKRGHRLKTIATDKTDIITSVREMVIMGVIVGYRVRTS